jgi:hypothetical protein
VWRSSEDSDAFATYADDWIRILAVGMSGIWEAGVGEFEGRELEGQEERRGVAVEGIVDRREYTRYAVDAWAEVMVKDGTMLFRGRVLDVSVGGCYIETEARLRLAPGTPVEIVFRAHDRVLKCDGTSRMVRTRGAGLIAELSQES